MWRIPEEILVAGNDNDALEFVKNQLINPDTFIQTVKHLYSEPEATSFDLLSSPTEDILSAIRNRR